MVRMQKPEAPSRWKSALFWRFSGVLRREMLCAGRPVVASPLRELAERSLAGVHVARSRADFIRACHRAVAPMTAAARREIILEVVSRTWRRVSESVRDVLLL